VPTGPGEQSAPRAARREDTDRGGVHVAVRVLASIWTHRWLSAAVRSHVMWWLNTKFVAGVTAVIRDDAGRVLFMEHAFRQRNPWALPGGWMVRGETPEEAIAREVREETSLEIEVLGLLNATTFTPPKLDIVYLCRVRSGTVRGSAETPRWMWCSVGHYPADADPYSIDLVELSEQEWTPGTGWRRR
jgi:ADP-ribose pyrophosphatase YjhB (NUDIX family)